MKFKVESGLENSFNTYKYFVLSPSEYVQFMKKSMKEQNDEFRKYLRGLFSEDSGNVLVDENFVRIYDIGKLSRRGLNGIYIKSNSLNIADLQCFCGLFKFHDQLDIKTGVLLPGEIYKISVKDNGVCKFKNIEEKINKMLSTKEKFENMMKDNNDSSDSTTGKEK